MSRRYFQNSFLEPPSPSLFAQEKGYRRSARKCAGVMSGFDLRAKNDLVIQEGPVSLHRRQLMKLNQLCSVYSTPYGVDLLNVVFYFSK